MAKSRSSVYAKTGGLILVLGATTIGVAYASSFFSVDYDQPLVVAPGLIDKRAEAETKNPEVEKPKIIPTHIATPDAVKAIYMSQCVVGTPNFRDKLVKLADETEINSIIIDIKDFTGKLSFRPENPALAASVSSACGAPDMIEFIDRLHRKNIYVIGRITVFQDPHMTTTRPELAVKKLSDGEVWKDYKGLSFIDVGAREHWKYIVDISKEAYKIGFDELNYDYIRFPSDGNMKDTDFTLSRGKTKPEALEEFFTYVHDEVKPIGAVISADLFGMVTTNKDDLNIGQVLERALPHFDYIAPMVYPSHYPKTFNGWTDPNKYPYELIHFVMSSAVNRAKEFDASFPTTSPEFLAKSEKKLRPWLQDFDYGGTYDIPEVKAQIQATYDVGIDSWMLWAPSNIYTQGALGK